jgi:hypothetical protein
VGAGVRGRVFLAARVARRRVLRDAVCCGTSEGRVGQDWAQGWVPILRLAGGGLIEAVRQGPG